MTTRFNLPDIEFVNKDVDEVEETIVNKIYEYSGITLSDADPRRAVVKAISFICSLLNNNIDYSAKQRLLSYAEDDFLDHLGSSENDTRRLGPTPAKATVRFEISLPPGVTSAIKNGIRVTPGNEVFYQVKVPVSVSSDMSYVDIEVECTEVGEIGNGYLPNQINKLVDPIPWVVKVYNTTKSEGGAEWENDDQYAERIRLANEAYSTAGPEGAYIFYAKSASQLISDVSVRTTTDGTVEIAPLLINGELPTEEILNLVAEKCNDRSVRPLTDKLVITLPDVINYDINVTYFLSREVESISSTIQESVKNSVQEYIQWQQQKLGRGIDPTELNFRMRQVGAKRITITSPGNFISLERHQIAKVNTVDVVFGGFINE